MRRIAHGSTSPMEMDAAAAAAGSGGVVEPFNFAPQPQPTPFTYLFPELSDDDACLLPQTDKTLQYLVELGKEMLDRDDSAKFNSGIPAAYTYFAQFVNHDIAFSEVEKPAGVTDSVLLNDLAAPWPKTLIFEKVRNKRASFLDLDCVYGTMPNGDPPPRDQEKMAVGKVSLYSGHARPKDKDDDNDLVRHPKRKDDPRSDRTALIADPRNDSNLIISQLHVAFLRAHNAFVDRDKCSFEEARRTLQMHYHWLVFNDFLRTIIPKNTIDQVLADPIYDPDQGLPFEFSVAAFRFGHSMVRSSYYLNDGFQEATLARLFTLIVLSNGLKPRAGEGFSNLPEHRIIQWRKFLDGGRNAARALRTQMVEPLFSILNETDERVDGEFRLAVQDLKRGYMMRIPTGQAVAHHLKLNPLSATEIEEVVTRTASPSQAQVLRDSGFSTKTPLSFYVLAEAAAVNNGQLGPVGSRIVAEVLIGLIRNIPYSFLNTGWVPTDAGKKIKFLLPDFLRRAGVLENP